jgi:hypothetical protein
MSALMQFLMTDGTVKDLVDVVSAEIEDGHLVGRGSRGDALVSFSRDDVIAYGASLTLKDSEDDRRTRPRDASR